MSIAWCLIALAIILTMISFFIIVVLHKPSQRTVVLGIRAAVAGVYVCVAAGAITIASMITHIP